MRQSVVASLLVFLATVEAIYSHSNPIIISHGLQNLGNTCYLNSQLQCAFHIPRVRSLIENPPVAIVVETAVEEEEEPANAENEEEGEGAKIEGVADEERDNPDEEQSSSESEPAQQQSQPEPESLAIQALRQVFRDMRSTSGPVAPRILCQVLGIPVLEQQDSQEFWKLLLPALQLPELTDLYQGCFEDYITANDGSKRERRREEPFLDLSLDVSRASVLDGLKEAFGTAELLSAAEGNGWRPEKDAEKVDALKGCLLRVQGLPSILQLHLKRFNYDWQKDQMSKINTQCSFPDELDLSAVCADIQDDEKSRACYALQSVVIHVGEFGSGHYYAYVRPDVLSNTWYRFNDHVVTKVSFAEVAADAYGGRNAKVEPESGISDNNNNKEKPNRGRGGFLRRLGSLFQSQPDPFGYGGRTSNAYVVQYVRKADISNLYLLDENA